MLLTIDKSFLAVIAYVGHFDALAVEFRVSSVDDWFCGESPPLIYIVVSTNQEAAIGIMWYK